MPVFYFTPAAIGYLTQGILAVSISIYLPVILYKNKLWNPQSKLLTAFFCFIALFTGLLFLDTALLPAPRLYAVYLENPVLGVALLLMLQFAYHYPEKFKSRKVERYLALAASSGYALYEGGLALIRYWDLLVWGIAQFRPYWADYALAAILVWIPVAFLRQSIAADTRDIPWWRKLSSPQDGGAEGAREFAAIYLLAFALGMINILRAYSIVTTSVYNISISSGILIIDALFIARYFSRITGGITVLVKISAVNLTLFLVIIGSIGWMVAPNHVEDYQLIIPDRQTLRFTPNASGGYDVASAPFHFEKELGRKLNVTYWEGERSEKIAFDFPFYGKAYPEIYASNMGVITFGEEFFQPNLQTCCYRFPAIFPLVIDLDTTRGGGLFAREETDRLIITWEKLPALHQPQSIFTYQATLYTSGEFEISYDDLPTPIYFDLDASPSSNPWFRGISNGLGEDNAQILVDDLAQPYHGGGASGFREDFYAGFRSHLHRLMLPLAWTAVTVSILLLVLLPFMLHAIITKPINALLAGMAQMDAGEFDTHIPQQSADDIGILTRSFNKMAVTVKGLIRNLDRLVAERTVELTAANQQLRKEMYEREAAQEQLIAKQREVAILEERERMSRDLHDGLAQTIGFISAQTRAIQAMLESGDKRAADDNLSRLAQVAQDSQSELRRYILGLRAAKTQASLIDSVKSFIAEFITATDISVSISLPEETLPEFSSAAEANILHVIKEALINVRKHSGAKNVEALFSVDDRSLQVIVSDDGKGFLARQRAGDGIRHFGLEMMRERAEALGGRLEIRSAPDAGTKVMLFVPILNALPLQSEEGMGGFRILLADDSALFAEGLKKLLIARGLVVVGIARDGIEALEQTRLLRPDVVVMDVMMPRMDGLAAARAINNEFPEVKVLMLTASEKEEHLIEAVRAGVSGFLLKGMDANEFVGQIASLMRGETVLPHNFAARALAEFQRRQENAPQVLNSRQQEILDMVGTGMTYKEIGTALHISEKTVKYHMRQILNRLQVQKRNQALAYARSNSKSEISIRARSG